MKGRLMHSPRSPWKADSSGSIVQVRPSPKKSLAAPACWNSPAARDGPNPSLQPSRGGLAKLAVDPCFTSGPSHQGQTVNSVSPIVSYRRHKQCQVTHIRRSIVKSFRTSGLRSSRIMIS